jgi:hypothetical protein
LRSYVPVVGATETEPAGKSYQGWMLMRDPGFAQSLSEAAIPSQSNESI